MGQAQARALATHQRVVVTALTTPNSVTTANPSGSFTQTVTLRPTRTVRHGRWVPLSATLRRAPGGEITPAATVAPLTLSSGGSGPLAVLNESGYPLSLTWPTPLPTPVLSGSTATYPNVLPGVNLLVTADDQGNVTTTLVIKDAAAAANPALESLQITESAPGLALAADSWGSLSWSASPDGDPVFTAPAPRMWDSTPLPPDTPTVTEPDGTVVTQGAGRPAASSAAAPGAAATVTKVPVALAGDTITMSPPAAALTSPNITYPLYIDPSFDPDPVSAEATHWTQVESGFPGDTGHWDESGDLQVGYCWDGPSNPQCDDPQTGTFMGHARSFFRMPVSGHMFGATIEQSKLFTTDVWTPSNSCDKSAVDLWTTGPIRNDTSYAHQPSWHTNIAEQKVAFGQKDCPWAPGDVTWNVTSVIQDDANNSVRDQTFGLRANDESDSNQWKRFKSGSEDLTMSTTYTLPPSHPDRTTSPGGACAYGTDSAPVIGNDDMTFYATTYDATQDDNTFTTRFLIIDPATGLPVYDSDAIGNSPKTADGDTAQLIISRTDMAGLNPNKNGGAYTYYWYARVTNSEQQTSSKPTDFCYFTYNPAGPATPTVTFSPLDATAQLGSQQLTATFKTPGCGSATAPCPTTYTYQDGAAPPANVNANASGVAANVQIPVTQLGTYQFSVYGTAASGNQSGVAAPTVTGTNPNSAYPDGYFSGGSHPDLLLTGTSPTTPSLWLYPGSGSGDGTVGAPVDIGSLGTTIIPQTSPPTTSDGPGDWQGAEVLHGDFTGRGIQDVMAYYPATSFGAILPGNGNDSTPYPGHAQGVKPVNLLDNITGTDPIQVVAAGKASGPSSPGLDLIGVEPVAPNSASYQLELYVGCGLACWDDFNGPDVLSFTPPDTGHNSNWGDYTLATAEPGCAPGGSCDPSTTVLFALDNKTETLWEAASPGQLTVGSNNGWKQITVPPIWGTNPPTLVSADTNASGNVELWTTNGAGTTVTSYTVTGTAPNQSLSREHATQIPQPSDEWPLTDGDPQAQGHANATTAVDTTGGNTATRTGAGAHWGSDTYFHTDIKLGDQQNDTGYFPAAPSTIPTTDPTPTISAWFKTTATGGVIASLQGTALTPNGTSATFDPVLYVGDDGYLHAQWYTGHVTPLTSANSTTPVIVDDGLWHHAVLATTGSGSTTTQTLTVDGIAEGSITSALDLQGDTNGNTNLTFGAGYLGGNWPNEANQGSPSAPAYFIGQIADITFNQ